MAMWRAKGRQAAKAAKLGELMLVYAQVLVYAQMLVYACGVWLDFITTQWHAQLQRMSHASTTVSVWTRR